MSTSAKFYIFSPNGFYIDWSYTSVPGFSVFGKDALVVGSAGSDVLLVGSGTSADATALGSGNDIIYLRGNFADYEKSVDLYEGTYTFTRNDLATGKTEVVKFKSTSDHDILYFADGHVDLSFDSTQPSGTALMDPDKGEFRQIVATDLVIGGTPAEPFKALPTPGTQATKVYIFDPNGLDVPPAAVEGESMVVVGGSGADRVYVKAATSMDFTNMGGGNDSLYLTGNFADYDKSVDLYEGTYTFTRNNLAIGKTEVVKFKSTSDHDILYFADGHVDLSFDSTQPSGTALMDPDKGEFRQIVEADLLSGGTPGLDDPVSGALSTLSTAAQSNSASESSPGVEVYAAAGVSGVTASNLKAINSALNTTGVSGTSVDTAAQVQALVDAYKAVLAGADGDASDNNVNLTTSQYGLLGLEGLNTKSTSLLNDVVDGKAQGAVDTAGELQELASAAEAVFSETSTLESLNLLGLQGVMNAKFAAIQSAISTAFTNGEDLSSLANLQALISSINNPPVLNSNVPVTLPTILEDTSSPANGSTGAGSLVSDLVSLGRNVQDADADAVTGIAITDVSSHGTLQYTLDGGTTWHVAQSVSSTHALLLKADPNTRIHFTPEQNFNGTLTDAFTFKAWDQTYGDAGSYVDTSHVLSFSTASDSVSIDITPVNDAAVIAGTTSGSLTETNAIQSTTGTLTSADVDGTANLFVAQTSVAGDSGYGTYTMTAGGVWTYTIDNNNATVNALNTGQTLSDTFTVTTVDGTAQTVTVAISGSTDVVSLSSITSGTGGFVINGAGLNNYSGYSVSNAGDVNGDGYDDLIIGTGTFAGTSNTGMSYVVFGGSAKTAIELSALGTTGDTNGFIINGAASAMSGWSVSGAGDVNGDGLADLIVGAKGTGAPTGTGYVVFGKTSNTTVALSSLGSGGFVMNGKDASGAVGYSVSAAGDVNGDGLADLIVGAPYTGGTGPAAGKGYTYVVFGTTSSSAISLSSITGGAGGFKITGACTADNSGYSVSAAGDVNGDGYADLIVGAPNADSSGVVSSGSSYVIFGGSTSGDVTLSSALASGGFAINGTGASSYSGWSVSAAGDVNGDGLADVIVGAKGSNSSAGASYVVFGKSTTAAVSLATVASATPSGGFVIYGQSASDESGLSVSNAGDLNGDGLSDLLVGAHYADPTTGTNAGRTYVVYGKTASTAVYLSAIAAGTGGFVINGQCASDESGISVSAGGDINGDGMADLIVGANNADPTSGSNAGRTYVIFGSTSGALGVGTAVDWVGTSADETRTSTGSQTLVGGAGNDTLTSSASTGADVLYGGQGNDTFVVTAAMVTALQSNFGAGGNITQLARIDGGTGVDILQLAGGTASAGVSLNLTAIKNAGVDSSRLESIEVIDLSADASLSGGKGNQLTLGLSDVLDMTGMNVFNSSTSGIGSSGGTALAQSVMKHQLMIWGDSSDYVSIGVSATGWVKSSTNTAITYTYTDIGGTSHTHTMVAYNYYSATVYAQLLIDQAIVNATAHLT